MLQVNKSRFFLCIIALFCAVFGIYCEYSWRRIVLILNDQIMTRDVINVNLIIYWFFISWICMYTHVHRHRLTDKGKKVKNCAL